MADGDTYADDYLTELYEFYTFEAMDVPGHINTVRKIYITSSIILNIFNGLLLTTFLCKETRSQSAAMYLYHLVCLTVVFGLVINPMLYAGLEFTSHYGCLFLSSAARAYSLIHCVNVVLVNIEVLFTIAWPKVCFANYTQLRFAMTMGITWSVVMVFVLCLRSYTEFDDDVVLCWSTPYEIEAILHTSFTWLSALVVTCSTVAIVTISIRARFTLSGSYNQFTEYTNRISNHGDWFVCVLSMNTLFVIMDILASQILSMVNLSYKDVVYSQMLISAAHYTLPMTMLALRSVRRAIWTIATTVYNFVTYQRAGDDVTDQASSTETVSEDAV